MKANWRLLSAILDQISACHPDVVVTPECFLDGYMAVESDVSRDRLRESAVDAGGSEGLQIISDWTRQHKSWSILGCSRRDGADVFNSALVYDRRGVVMGMYDKTHLQAHDLKYTAGRSLPVFDSDFGKFGILICADRRWPEAVRTLAVKGARIVFNPTYGMHDDLNLSMMRTRSFESETFIVFTHPRQALITGPEGNVLSDDRDDSKGFVITEIDLSTVDIVRNQPFTHLKDRRPELYL